MGAIAETLAAAALVIAIFAGAIAGGWVIGRCADMLERRRYWRTRDAQRWADAAAANRRTRERIQRSR